MISQRNADMRKARYGRSYYILPLFLRSSGPFKRLTALVDRIDSDISAVAGYGYLFLPVSGGLITNVAVVVREGSLALVIYEDISVLCVQIESVGGDIARNPKLNVPELIRDRHIREVCSSDLAIT